MALMRRQSLVKFDAPLCETIVDTPKPQGAEVLVRIERCGLCHSDLHIQDGYADLGGGKKLDTTRGMVLPFTLGHEIAGVVDEVGPDAPKELIGQQQAFPLLQINNKILRLAPGGRIIDEQNRTIVHGSLPQQASVLFVEDMNGDISRIYLLRPDELERIKQAR